MNADRLTTLIGLLAASATAAGQTGLIPPHYTPIVGAVQTLAFAILGYFTAHKTKNAPGTVR
ncbi:MAG: hypothetical protein RBJ76_13570 [Stenomitos frigidus ULC029]